MFIVFLKINLRELCGVLISSQIMVELTGSPLIDLGLIWVQEVGPNLSPDGRMFVRDAFERLIQRTISYPEVIALLHPFPGGIQAIDRIERILQISPVPLPSFPIEREHGIREERAKSRPWTTYEDDRLLAAIHKLGTSDWSMIARFIGNNRSKGQCYQRWMRCLDPAINKSGWTREEDLRLLMFVAIYGEKAWAQICIELGDRCDVQCRYRYQQLSKDIHFQTMQEEARVAAAEFEQTNGISVKRRNMRKPVEPAHPVGLPVVIYPMYYVAPVPSVVFTPHNRVFSIPVAQISHAASDAVLFHRRLA